MVTKEKQTTLFGKCDSRGGHECPSMPELVSWSHQGIDRLPAQLQRHVEGCVKCAFDFTVWRAAGCLSQLPPLWFVHLGCALRQWESSTSYVSRQLLGKISVETQEFSTCQERDWTPSALAMRVNLVVDEELHFFSLAILDVPLAVDSIALVTSHGLRHFEQIGDQVMELLISDECDDRSDLSPLVFSDVWAQITAHKLEIAVELKGANGLIAGTGDVLEVLEHHQVIERNGDYALPCGQHCDTYLNIAKLCAHEDAMQLVAAKVDFLFWDTHFDTILANGWAMSLIGRRLADAREVQGRKEPVRQLQCEGYDDPTLLNDIVSGSQVLLLFDVVVTGTLASRLTRLVRSNGGDVVGIASLTKPHGAQLKVEGLRSLCELEMELSEKPLDRVSQDANSCQMVFNPIAGYMTTKTSVPRSPSAFLEQDANARELWQYVSQAQAYEHHRREGDTHYIGFVDTQKLLENREIGTLLVKKLVADMCASESDPDTLLVPDRSRARLLARVLARALEALSGSKPRIVYVRKNRVTGRWRLSGRQPSSFFERQVCIVDTAIGHGRTVDQLAVLAGRLQASSIAAAVLLSRLTPPCEQAFAARLNGGFYRLYSLPIRPVAIRGDRLDLCPVCRRKNAIRRFADDADTEALEQWATHLLRMRRGAVKQSPHHRERQLSLFDNERPFLSVCGGAVASGVTLHALGAASTNGSAPLALPELTDERIPWRVRATIVENLPSGILGWTGKSIVPDLVDVLSGEGFPSVWKAAANLLSREGSDAWLDHLEPLLRRLEETNHRTSPSFWNHMACNAYLLASSGEHVREDFYNRIDLLMMEDFGDIVEKGLRQMKEVVCP